MSDCRRPLCRRAPSGRLSHLIPNSHFPVVALVRGEWPPAIGDVETLTGLHSTGIPQASAILGKFFRRRGDQNPVAALPQVVGFRQCRPQFPAKARSLAIDTSRIGGRGDLQVLRGNSAGNCCHPLRIRTKEVRGKAKEARKSTKAQAICGYTGNSELMGRRHSRSQCFSLRPWYQVLAGRVVERSL
jgi:hypothetical protein